jgi:hypothetical protein
MYTGVKQPASAPGRQLTVKLRGRPEAPARRRGRTLSSSARGAKQQAPHGPLQRLLDGDAAAEAYFHSIRNATQTPTPTTVQTIRSGTVRIPTSESRNTIPPISKSGAVIPQWNVRFLRQFATQPEPAASKIVLADAGPRGRQ